ncbi:hypothetical protein [Sphingomonas sp. VNH70]|uniref:hypothetical protein n=1 Tax=Sphingomonas silueang TaxID=3156617 RepID=UPI0032B58C69
MDIFPCRALLALSIASLAGCGGGATQQQPSPMPTVNGQPSPAPSLTPIAQARSPTLPAAVSVTTNEPFYRAVVDGGTIRLSGVDSPERRLPILSQEAVAGGRRWRAEGLVVTVTNKACTDDMSGEPRPFSGMLEIGGPPVRGCAFPTPVASPVTIPARFLGRWDRDAAACAAPATSIEGVTISLRELRFHESVGEVTAVAPGGAGVTIDARYSGEGETWTTHQSLTLDGDRLTIMGEGAPIRRVRCAG